MALREDSRCFIRLPVPLLRQQDRGRRFLFVTDRRTNMTRKFGGIVSYLPVDSFVDVTDGRTDRPCKSKNTVRIGLCFMSSIPVDLLRSQNCMLVRNEWSFWLFMNE